MPITPVDSARNLGLWFDTHLTFDRHISDVCKIHFIIYSILGYIPKHLTPESAEKIIHAFVTSRLDYCNSLFLGLHDSQIGKLQRVQNACARLVCNYPCFSHCTPVTK